MPYESLKEIEDDLWHDIIEKPSQYTLKLYEDTYKTTGFSTNSKEDIMSAIDYLLDKEPKPAFSINILVSKRNFLEV